MQPVQPVQVFRRRKKTIVSCTANGKRSLERIEPRARYTLLAAYTVLVSGRGLQETEMEGKTPGRLEAELLEPGLLLGKARFIGEAERAL